MGSCPGNADWFKIKKDVQYLKYKPDFWNNISIIFARFKVKDYEITE